MAKVEDVNMLKPDVPFEFVGEVTGASPMAKAGHVESSASTTGHDDIEAVFVKWWEQTT